MVRKYFSYIHKFDDKEFSSFLTLYKRIFKTKNELEMLDNKYLIYFILI